MSYTLGGHFTIQNNKATVIVGINEDADKEGDEVLKFAITGTGAQASVIIASDTTSFSPDEKLQSDDSSSSPIPPDREIQLPKAGTPITGPGGEIIDVPIDNPGDPYKEAPSVFITGNGFSANGIALLDTKGYVTEVRITDPGFGYKLNKPQDANKECIIDAFTMIRPGKGYTTAPDVYINGDKDIAEAIVENGQVISIRIKNREITFSSYPDVIILGGGGYGSTFLPSFSCLEPEARVKIGSAKVGTGSYIDCP